MTAPPREPFVSLREQLLALQHHAFDVEKTGEDEVALTHASRRSAARNLIDYLAVRQRDTSDLQRDLQRHGFSSLGVIQGHVMASIDAVLGVLDSLTEGTRPALDLSRYPSIDGARHGLRAYADETFGPCPADGAVRIMVTMPSEAATDPDIIDGLLAQGMTVMRVNCAHDGPDVWSAMIKHLRAAERKHKRTCRVSFDLAGPKLRTGPIAPGPEVLRFKPVRDSLGRVTSPGVIAFRETGATGDDEEPVVPLGAQLHGQARSGDTFRLIDSRGRQRELSVDTVGVGRLICTTEQTVYLTTGTELELWRDDRCVDSGAIGTLPALESAIPLEPGDALIVTRDLAPGQAASRGDDDEVMAPARIGCSLPAVFTVIRCGHRVLLDDGKFAGVVRETNDDWFRLEIQRAGRGRASLKAEKGINLPDTALDLPALTEKDLDDLSFVVQHADLVAMSFVHEASDIDRLYAELDRLNTPPDLGVILKIENCAAFERLPELLMTASKRRRIGVMVARGDLGVEIGFERLAEVQEEILWLTEAAQVPVIWATQVLESLAKDGLPSRAEVTDAAMSTRAECVMLNKGPYIGDAISFLSDVSRRMRRHARKTFARNDRLNVASSGWLEVDRAATQSTNTSADGVFSAADQSAPAHTV